MKTNRTETVTPATATSTGTAFKGKVFGTPFVAHTRTCIYAPCTQAFWATESKQVACRTCTVKAAKAARETRERETKHLAAIAAKAALDASLKAAVLAGKALPEGYTSEEKGRQVVIKGPGLSITFYKPAA